MKVKRIEIKENLRTWLISANKEKHTVILEYFNIKD
jgi:hypothetical protein